VGEKNLGAGELNQDVSSERVHVRSSARPSTYDSAVCIAQQRVLSIEIVTPSLPVNSFFSLFLSLHHHYFVQQHSLQQSLTIKEYQSIISPLKGMN
jgi:hypothetical protein